MSLEKKDVIELVLTVLAVIAGSIAASGAFVSAAYEQQRVTLEEKPAILLSCEPEFTSLDMAQGIKPETNAAFLDNRGAGWIHIADLDRAQTPAPFARCTLINYGRLPLLNVRLAITLQGKTRSLDVPGLASSERFTFSLINGTNTTLRFAFLPAVTVTRVDTGLDDTVVLFLSRSLITLQGRAIEPATMAKVGDLIQFTNSDGFANTATLIPQATSFPSGSPFLASAQTQSGTLLSQPWSSGTLQNEGAKSQTILVDKPGTYLYGCFFHYGSPMRGAIVAQ